MWRWQNIGPKLHFGQIFCHNDKTSAWWRICGCCLRTIYIKLQSDDKFIPSFFLQYILYKAFKLSTSCFQIYIFVIDISIWILFSIKTKSLENMWIYMIYLSSNSSCGQFSNNLVLLLNGLNSRQIRDSLSVQANYCTRKPCNVIPLFLD